MKYFWRMLQISCYAVLATGAFNPITSAAVIEHYLMVSPLVTENETARQNNWFNNALRDTFAEAALTLDSLIYLKEDELRLLVQEYGIGTKAVDDKLMEKLADKLDVAVLYGQYAITGNVIIIKARLIANRNAQPQEFTIKGDKKKLKLLFSSIINEVVSRLNLTSDEMSRAHIKQLPGTNNWAAMKTYTQAMDFLRLNAKSKPACERALPLLNQVLKSDPDFISARAYRASCRLAVAIGQKGSAKNNALSKIKQDLDYAVSKMPDHPLVHNAHVEYLIAKKQYKKAALISEKALSSYPANHWQYFLLGRLYRILNKPTKAEKVLVQGLDLQGTAMQKKVFKKELGMLLLNIKDREAVQYLAAVTQIEPKNARLYFLQAEALYRLENYLEAMKNIDMAESIHRWSSLDELKAKTALALGNEYFENDDFDKSLTFLSIALNLRKKDFNINLLLSKVMRKKGLNQEARQQLYLAKTLATKKQSKDFLLLGTEYIAQGFRMDGADAYEVYIENNPDVPEADRLRGLIRKLRGEDEY